MSRDGDRSAESVAELIDLERAQIGHDIHDLLIPLIFSASAELQPLIHRGSDDPLIADPDRQRVVTSQRRLEEALDLSRRLLTQIYPPELAHSGWLAAAKDSISRIVDDVELIWKVDESCPLLTPDLDHEVASASYRILVQAVRNAIAHGKGDTIAIRLLADSMVVVDDGRGFDPESVPADRFGLRSMRGRARLIGKRLDIESQIGGPTSVTLWLG
ncbi:MAG: ATP-binding protein [Planctomycetota bacterium]